MLVIKVIWITSQGLFQNFLKGGIKLSPCTNCPLKSLQIVSPLTFGSQTVSFYWKCSTSKFNFSGEETKEKMKLLIKTPRPLCLTRWLMVGRTLKDTAIQLKAQTLLKWYVIIRTESEQIDGFVSHLKNCSSLRSSMLCGRTTLCGIFSMPSNKFYTPLKKL